MRVKMVHTSLDYSVLLAGKSWRGYSAWQLTKQMRAQSVITLVITGGGAKFIKHTALISKTRSKKYLK